MTNDNLTILANIISGVESGGQIYGNKNYSAYAKPYQNSPEEHTITLGWNQQYGARAKKLVQMIYDRDKSLFTNSITSKLSTDWVSTRWNPSSTDKATLIKIISSSTGKQCQDEIFYADAKAEISRAESYGISDVGAQMMWVEIAWLGGTSAAQRIFNKISKPYTADKVYETLKLDQKDTNNNNQVGDKIYQSRHDCCVKWIKQYVGTTSTVTESKGSDAMSVSASKATEYATKLLKHWPFVYCPTLAGFTTNKTPHKGDVVLFYRNGTFAHTGYVYKVSGSTYYTIEGNTSGASGVIANGGAVCKKSYSTSAYPGTKFFRPDYSILVSAGIFKSADDAINKIIAVAEAEVGYLEKKSNSQLDSKTANVGSANYTRYWKDIYPQFQGQAWCACFVSWIFKHAIMGKSSSVSSSATVTVGKVEVVSSSASNLLKRGSKGSAVKTLQQNLNKLMNAKLDVDGDFGPATEKAVKAFQKQYSLEVDGIVGNATQSKITSLLQSVNTTTEAKKDTASTTTTSSKLNETEKCKGYVKTLLNVRTYAGTEYGLCSFSPLGTGTIISICDTIKAADGSDWHYIKYQGKYGFVSAKYIKEQ